MCGMSLCILCGDSRLRMAVLQVTFDRKMSAQFSSTNSALVALIAICLRSSLLQIQILYVHHVNE